jgi:putative ABC transport system ATP-binding protein
MTDVAGKPPLLEARHVGKTYPDGQVAALVDVSVTLKAGDYVAIMGPSGSGKSTLLNVLGALDRPDTGEVFYEGQPLPRHGRLDQFRSQKVGFVFQAFHLLATLTALENVQVPMFEGPLGAAARARRAGELLDAVGVRHRATHLPSRLSIGERQRVAIARALANDPVVLLADEPTGNLDSQSAAAVLDLFASLHRDRGLTLVVVTHSPEVAERARRVLWLRDGRIVRDEPFAPDAGEERRSLSSSPGRLLH